MARSKRPFDYTRDRVRTEDAYEKLLAVWRKTPRNSRVMFLRKHVKQELLDEAAKPEPALIEAP